MKKRTKPFTISVPDSTANGGISRVTFDPQFDRVPSTKELVTSVELARKYAREVFKKNP